MNTSNKSKKSSAEELMKNLDVQNKALRKILKKIHKEGSKKKSK